MYHYLFTNDLRISHLEDSLIEAGRCFETDTVPSASVDKNANNNMNTLGFYFNLTLDSLCAKECSNRNVRRVVLNFIKKFQFPNPRTRESYEQTTADGILLAPMRVILQVLYVMNMQSENGAYLTKKEIADFIFFNSIVAKTSKIDLLELIKQISDFRASGSYPASVELDNDKRAWKQEERQVREMVKVLTWSGCVVEDAKGNISLCSDNLTTDNKADLFDILSYGKFWNPTGSDFNEIKKNYQQYMDLPNVNDSETEDGSNLDTDITPSWFEEKAVAFPTLDSEGNAFLNKFRSVFSIEKLARLEGKDVLNTIFLNPNNKTNLCYTLEFDKDCRDIFGSIKSGTAYKYGLHYSQKNSTWATGSGRKPQFLSQDEAIELGTQIRDYLLAGADAIANFGNIESIDDYEKLYQELDDVTDGYINRMWFIKYYALLYPEIFPPIYSTNAQNTVLQKLGIVAASNSIARIGQIREYVNKCHISNIMFSRIFWTYCNSDNNKTDDELEDNMEENTYIAPVYNTEILPDIERNRIVFGAPGTGKSWQLKDDSDRLLKETEGSLERVTFHPDYSYAQFVGTYKPVSDEEGNIRYEFVAGPFMRVFIEAIKSGRSDKPQPHILLIEEINRAKVAAVFGDVFQLLDRDEKGVSEYEIQTSQDVRKYLAKKLGGEPEQWDTIKLPDNMFIWSTMNSADQGVFPMDTAFKRRWNFEYIGINDNEDITPRIVRLGKDDEPIDWNKLRRGINKLLSEKYHVNEDKLMGPYFLSNKITAVDENGEIKNQDKFKAAFESKVLMYLYEDAAKQHKHKLFGEYSATYSGVCDAFEEIGIRVFGEDFKSDYYEA